MSIKIISSKTDLAINGAPPAFDKPLHVGRPNIGDHDAFLQRVSQILDSQWLTNNGPMVQEFERSVATQLGVKHCVAMCNGTIALEIAIRALGLTGEVIIPSWTFVATAHALHWQGITPVFADIDPTTHNLDPEAVQRMITPRTTGIIGVHLWGRAAPIDELQAIANERGLKLMFDAAHGFGSTYKGQRIGQFGACEVLSFHATKSFNTFEGGAVVTNDDELAETARLMRNFGFVHFDKVIHPGTNGKMVEVCAAMGLANLASIEATTAVNRRNYDAYRNAFAEINGIAMISYDDRESNSYHYMVTELDESTLGISRDTIVTALHAEGILARKYFWPGCHRMEPYQSLFPHANLLLSRTEEVANRTIVFPNGTTLPEGAIQTIADVIKVLSEY